jgi:outer membrane murein-binding lipoprotein Lpp
MNHGVPTTDALVWVLLFAIVGLSAIVLLVVWLALKLIRRGFKNFDEHGRVPIEAFMVIFAGLTACMVLTGCATQRDFDRHKSVDAAVSEAETQAMIQLLEAWQKLDRRVAQLEVDKGVLEAELKDAERACRCQKAKAKKAAVIPNEDDEDDQITSLPELRRQRTRLQEQALDRMTERL